MNLPGIVVGMVLAIAIVISVAAPIGPLPGFFIGGTPAAAPETWPDTSDVDNVTLKIVGGVPRVVIVWIIQHEGELHVIGRSTSGWTKKLGPGGPVELRMGDETYSLTASRLQSGWEPVATAYMDKYREDSPELIASFPPIEEAAGVIAAFRLGRCSPLRSHFCYD